MSAPSIKLKTILWGVAVAAFMSGPVQALDDDLVGSGTIKGSLSARGCGGEAFNVESTIIIIEEAPFAGQYILSFGDQIIGLADLDGIYIESSPNSRLVHAVDIEDFVELNFEIDDLLEFFCDGELVDSVVITFFQGTLRNNNQRLTLRFRSTFTWEDDDERERAGSFNFDAEFNDLEPFID